ncbi:MAG: FAD-binding oxidoreductase [Hyphomicrobium sp.]|uniref:NAD(P)/FAD-dependent oxidoreductase n=1 Tax=Hyphomicrobium sp. TaxID=82 RepID=UPI0013264D55|nr:FAD-binding oxidoreductase [Hyphomicrobium sp.]KAB2940213.1 MAG: FAD-binding oxidoreductase [Hyphomicrobium sp.]MBZ0208111.1 FAD-binding oxidoreductase [Hyphomicrobium sp.]
MPLPDGVTFVVIGGGVHGLSTAYHLAKRLREQSRGSGADVLVLDKGHIGSGASGIACGVVRNNYYQPAMRELMAHSVSVWERHTAVLSYHSVGYMQISPECMHEQVGTIYEQEKAIAYPSVFVEGAKDCDAYMKGLFGDWQAQNITSVLHEKKGGYANNMRSVEGLARLARSEGVRIETGVKVTGFERSNGSSSAVRTVVTDKGKVRCEQVVVGAGPWIKQIWDMLYLPNSISIKGRDGKLHDDVQMWTFWSLQEGTLGVDPRRQKTNDGNMPPVIHVDTDAPLYSDIDGSLITDKLWGIYYKPDFYFGGVQGGAMPLKINTDPDKVAVDPYGPASPDFIVGEDFRRMWCSALAHCQARFVGQSGKYRDEPSGGIGCFTPDNFPIFDRFCENVYVIADSNHGYKMIGVGELVATELTGTTNRLLEPFRFDRYVRGELHPVSNSPYPWS